MTEVQYEERLKEHTLAIAANLAKMDQTIADMQKASFEADQFAEQIKFNLEMIQLTMKAKEAQEEEEVEKHYELYKQEHPQEAGVRG